MFFMARQTDPTFPLYKGLTSTIRKFFKDMSDNLDVPILQLNADFTRQTRILMMRASGDHS
jgi:hypothetical protein